MLDLKKRNAYLKGVARNGKYIMAGAGNMHMGLDSEGS
jgi:hypothetical protein